MNPESAPQSSPEYREPAPDHYEQGSGINHETIGEQSHEREQNMRQVDRQNGPPLPPPTSIPAPQAPVALPTVQQASDDTVGPTVANDDDLIEEEKDLESDEELISISRKEWISTQQTLQELTTRLLQLEKQGSVKRSASSGGESSSSNSKRTRT